MEVGAGGGTSLQAKMQRLSGNAPAVAAASELLDALRVENAELQADNERLLAYAESLEAPGGGAGSGGGTPLLLLFGFLTGLEHDCPPAASWLERAGEACVHACMH